MYIDMYYVPHITNRETQYRIYIHLPLRTISLILVCDLRIVVGNVIWNGIQWDSSQMMAIIDIYGNAFTKLLQITRFTRIRLLNVL